MLRNFMMRSVERWVRWIVAMLLLLAPLASQAENRPIDISTFFYWYAQDQGTTPGDPLVQLMQARPEIRIHNWSGLNLPGDTGGRTPLMMSIAGQTAPDLYYCWFHIVRNDISRRIPFPPSWSLSVARTSLCAASSCRK